MRYSFDYLKKDSLLAKVFVYDKYASVCNYTEDVLDLPFGLKDRVSLADLERFMEERVFPRDRVNAAGLLKGKLYGYTPIEIIRETHGIMCHDYNWVRFSGEDLCWDDVKDWHDHSDAWYRVYDI